MELLWLFGMFIVATVLVLGWFNGVTFVCTLLTLMLGTAMLVTANAGSPEAAAVLLGMICAVWIPHYARRERKPSQRPPIMDYNYRHY